MLRQQNCQSTATITDDALMTAYALSPSFNPRDWADVEVIEDVTLTPGATSSVNSVLTGPVTIEITLPCKTLRALIFIASVPE